MLLEVGWPPFHNGINILGIFHVHQTRRRLAWKIFLGGRLKFKLKPKFKLKTKI